MNGFEWSAIALILFGMVIPFWIMTVLTGLEVRRMKKPRVHPSRVMSYNELMDYLHSAWKKAKADGQSGASLLASIRELKSYPEQRDITVLYLEEITVTGAGKFNELVKKEIKEVEDYLLSYKDED